MQKKLIAIAVAAALAPAAAMAADLHEAASGGTHPSVMGTSGTTLYGRIHTSIDSITGVTGQSESIGVNSSASRFGVKGSEDLGDGLSAVYQLESGVTSTGAGADGSGGAGATGPLFTNMRDTYIGLAGGFGTFLAGRLPAANQYVYDSNLFTDQIGDAGNFTGSALVIGRANSALHYVSPSMSGFNAALTYLPGTAVGANVGGATVVRAGAVSAKTQLSADTNTTAGTHGKNSYGIKLNYAGMGATASLTYFNVQYVNAVGVTAALKPLSIAGSYDFGNGMVTAQYVKAKTTLNSTDLDTTKYYNIGGKFNVASNAAIKVQYSKAGETLSNEKNGAKMWAVGYDYSLSKRTGVYAAYATTSNDTNGNFGVAGWGHGGNNSALAVGDDPRAFSVGLTHNF